MAYRNGTYVAFDGNGEKNPANSDFKYYSLLKGWKNSKNIEFTFNDSHEKTYSVRDDSLKQTLRTRLRERMKNSKNMLLILLNDTSWDRGELNYEIELAVDEFNIPIIAVYPNFSCILDPVALNKYWPKSLQERIDNKTAKCIHIPFKEKLIFSAISQFSINDDTIDHPLAYYDKQVYINLGLI